MEISGSQGFVFRTLKFIERTAVKLADECVVAHESFRSNLIEVLGAEPPRVHVIRNWSHIGQNPSYSKKNVRDMMGWGNKIVILHTGNMGEKQGLSNVIETARLAESDGGQLLFVLLGNGVEKRSLLNSAIGINSIQFLEPVIEDLYSAVLEAADILLVNEKPGVSEMSVPSKLTSYFMAGKPIVACSSPSGTTAIEILAAGAGIVVPAGEPQLLLGAISNLLLDEKKMLALGSRGQKYAQSYLSAEAAKSRFSDLLWKQS
jgi:glycosyltransferase involved in cell wall biosynthesis